MASKPSSAKACQSDAAKYAVPAVVQVLDFVDHRAQHPGDHGITEFARTLSIPTNGVLGSLRCLTARGYSLDIGFEADFFLQQTLAGAT